MRYHVLATDYDGTLAHHGRVDDETLNALERLMKSGRKLLLVTGRELEDLLEILPMPGIFTRIVAENGALVYRPDTRETKLLGEPPPEELVERLRERGVDRMSVGRGIIASWEPHQHTILDAIQELGLEWQLIFNKGAVMVLPSGMNKAVGLRAVLQELGLSPHNTVGIGDAENDHAFLDICGFSVAVDNALPGLKEHVDYVTERHHGGGVVQLVDALLDDDLDAWSVQQTRRHLSIGKRIDNEEEVLLHPYDQHVLLCGESGSGKTLFTAGFLELLAEKKLQFFLTDPEGDYQRLESAAILGDSNRAPAVEEVIAILENPSQSCVANLVGLSADERKYYFDQLLSALLELYAHTGRPHWAVLDESDHLLPESGGVIAGRLPRDAMPFMLVSAHPEKISPEILKHMNGVVVFGEAPNEPLQTYCNAVGQRASCETLGDLPKGQAIGWWPDRDEAPFLFRGLAAKREHQRHRRKYATGEMSPDTSFYFKGPDDKLHLRAHNLVMFMHIADGVDEETWKFHLRRGDYSRWFEEAIGDNELAEEAREIEKDETLAADEGRQLMRAKIEARYTGPA